MEELADRYAVSEHYNWQQGDADKVTPLKCVTIFCWFTANEAACYRDVSDRFHVAKSALFKIVRRMTIF